MSNKLPPKTSTNTDGRYITSRFQNRYTAITKAPTCSYGDGYLVSSVVQLLKRDEDSGSSDVINCFTQLHLSPLGLLTLHDALHFLIGQESFVGELEIQIEKEIITENKEES